MNTVKQAKMGKTTAAQAAIVVWIGAALLILGALLPWYTISAGFISMTKTGTDGDGVFILGLGLLALLSGLGVRSGGRVGSGGAVVSGILALVIWTVDFQNVTAAIAKAPSGISASLGVGLWVVLIGGIVTIAGAALAPSKGTEA